MENHSLSQVHQAETRTPYFVPEKTLTSSMLQIVEEMGSNNGWISRGRMMEIANLDAQRDIHSYWSWAKTKLPEKMGNGFRMDLVRGVNPGVLANFTSFVQSHVSDWSTTPPSDMTEAARYAVGHLVYGSYPLPHTQQDIIYAPFQWPEEIAELVQERLQDEQLVAEYYLASRMVKPNTIKSHSRIIGGASGIIFHLGAFLEPGLCPAEKREWLKYNFINLVSGGPYEGLEKHEEGNFRLQCWELSESLAKHGFMSLSQFFSTGLRTRSFNKSSDRDKT